ncbi:unnamed protein product [Chondrus crispus]|uniref:AAA+ ATPase domain-containing protein n=1 Tax=Chondrus crispus TaxID=2769 RepID=R7QBJ3_CHOCR|nr:unnamed protein product [Chondrus crispus]CDF34835.1 unnamed protein product [Chondrus crispus]|eukprot:XP_005714654.1 unnamed protein product [Chondrus crispus]
MALPLSLDKISLNDPPCANAHDVLLAESVATLTRELSGHPSGLLLTGFDRPTRRQIVSAAVSDVSFISCAQPHHDTTSELVQQRRLLCLDDLDSQHAEGLAKGIFTRCAGTTVLALAADKKTVSASLLRAGRLEKVVHMLPPPRSTREKAWRSVLIHVRPGNGEKLDVDEKARELADWSPGFAPNDFRLTLLRFLAKGKDGCEGYARLKKVVAAHQPKAGTLELDFVNASAMSPGAHATTHWDGVGGYADVKEMLVRLCEWPVRHKDTFNRLGVDPPRGVLLHGPRGCGKTRLALAFLRRLRYANWLHVNAPDVFSKYLGESEARVRALFDRARELSPCVVFIDELEAMGGGRMAGGDAGGTGVEQRVLGSLLTELDGVTGGDVFVLACAGDKNALDVALLRPGRLDHLVEVRRPALQDREEILRELLRGEGVKEEVVRRMARESVGMSGADLEALCREAAMVTMEEVETPQFVEMRHFWVANERMPKRSGSLAGWNAHGL